jgi:hypothetical protein
MMQWRRTEVSRDHRHVVGDRGFLRVIVLQLNFKVLGLRVPTICGHRMQQAIIVLQFVVYTYHKVAVLYLPSTNFTSSTYEEFLYN